MFMTPPPFAFPPPFAPPGFPVGPMNAPPPPFPPYNQFQPPPNLPYPIPPRINSTISAPINTAFPPPPHPPSAPSPRVTQTLPPPLMPSLVNVSFSLLSMLFCFNHSVCGPPPLHPLNPPLPAPPPPFTSLPPPCTSAPQHQHDIHAPHMVSNRVHRSPVQRSPHTPQPSHQQHHSHGPFSRDRSHMDRSPRATPPSQHQHYQQQQQQQHSRQITIPSSVSQQTARPLSRGREMSPAVVKKEPRDRPNDESHERNGRATPSRSRPPPPSSEGPSRAGPIKRERVSSDAAEEATPSPKPVEDDKKPPLKKVKEEEAVTSWRTYYNAELARQKEIELNLDIDPEMVSFTETLSLHLPSIPLSYVVFP
ncbi:unnamed protein product [Heligmosomoides polygyrus]|uniref:WW domain-binding protein 11 n=1 Tax=Heligmosomoides polygyrus TaxID=6339 RepID=A0A183GTN2_HELPZ|nr:unnamed protein product [Heligmosomoides polygyrus]